MIPGKKLPDGSLLTSVIAPQPGDSFVGGIALSPDGAVRITDGSDPQVYANGFGLMNIGAVCVDPGGAIDHYAMGLPFTVDGRLVVQLDQPVSPGDAYVGGVRVGPLGGVYVTETPPAPFDGFSTGFDAGYGA